jgi:uridine phosphorylase
MRRDFPILEHDDERESIIDPRRVVAPIAMAPRCVLCFFHEVIERWKLAGSLREVTRLTTTMGSHPVYEWRDQDLVLTLIHPGLGAPLSALLLEELIALGCRAFIACGGAGVLDKGVGAGHVVVPTAAVRDDGTSYHYVPPGREVAPDSGAVEAISRTLAAASVPFRLAKTWTTDAVYRETPGRVAARRAEGCLTVEMEAAALFAVARFRRVPLASMLYGGDDVSGLTWDQREGFDRVAVREKLVRLAGTACMAIPLVDQP